MSRKIKRVYDGLPEELIGKVRWVKRDYRTNELSFIPGGTDVVVEYYSHEVFGYDWIKDPVKYIASFWPTNDLRNSSKLFRLFARSYEDEAYYESARFEEIWNNNTSTDLLLDAIKDFSSTKQFRIYNIKSKPIFVRTDTNLSGRIRGGARRQRPIFEIDKETKSLINPIRMKGKTRVNKKEFTVYFTIDQFTFEEDISRIRDLSKEGMYSLSHSIYYLANKSETYSGEAEFSNEWKFDKDIIIARYAVYKGEK